MIRMGRYAGLSLLCVLLLMLSAGCMNPSQDTEGPAAGQEGGSNHLVPLVIYTEEQPPFNYINEEGLVAGRSTEVVREIMKRLEIQHPIILVKWTDGYNRALTDDNAAIFSTIRTHQRESMFKWVGPIAELQYSFYVRSDNPVTITSTLDLRDRGLIAVVKNDAREQYLRALNLSNLLLMEEDSDCIEALSSGKAEFWLGTREMATQNAKRKEEMMYGFRIADIRPITHQLYIAFNRKTTDSEIERWQKTLDEMREDGTYELIQSRYMPYICSWVRCTP